MQIKNLIKNIMIHNQNEIIYLRAKELRQIVREKVATSFTEDSDLRDMLLKLSTDIPLHIGISLNLNSLEQIMDHLNSAKKKLTELCVAIDLITNEYFKFDETKLNAIINEISELIPVKIQKAEEEERLWMDEIMQEFYIKENE
ncbi:MAG: hypothetical protein IPN88_03140 [Bacteroidetes bacterium]|nr:hypothetical protein [Bacteroidota bacterium]